ncbi:protein Red-like [Montipora capricornis]|uniref:protein Red-like n=1 Tax=Montipora capricornis TaxID=246305 RepID=UPI0035F1FDF0
MPSEGVEVFSNPLAPPSLSGHHGGHPGGIPALTNEDFRKLLMTPRSGAPSVAPPSAKPLSHSLKSVPSSIHSHRISRDDDDDDEDDDEADENDPWSRRRKKKKYYAKLKKMEEEREQELASKYRDRARERRDGLNPDYQSTDTLNTTANYRAVGPTAEATNTAAERRRQAIQESKFLGGDMEHTHLVKGLDFALLQKVRSEIAEDEEEDEELNVKKAKYKQKDKEEEDNGDEIEFTSKLGQKVYKALFRSRPPERNELFQPGRMAYVFDVEDEYAESDIPTTLIRSKADCPGIETQATLTTNDIVINKLTQILLYLRQGTRAGKKIKKKDRGKEKEKNEKQSGQKVRPTGADDSIFGDVGEYDPTETTKEYEKKSRTKEKERERDRKKSRNSSSYFDKSAGGEDDAQFNKKDVSAEEFAKSVAQTFGKKHEMEERAAWDSVDPKQRRKDRSSRKVKDVNYIPDSYSECYPGAVDVPYDSDEEADYSKMDLGNKKGPIKRWDFETEEDYHSYMESREALPKAAFQFGIKMSEGRKTRRAGPKDEKAKLDRDWQKISKMLSKRKEEGGGDRGESESKRRKH